MYSDFQGFARQPVQSAANPGCYWESMSHRQARSCLMAGMAQGVGFVVITGEAGTGKTTLVAHVMATIDRDRLTTAHTLGGQFARGQTIAVIARSFGLDAPIVGLSTATCDALLLDALLCFLRDEKRAGRRCLLVVDEAQSLPTVALESLRLLSDFELGGRPLLQIVLLGQSNLRTRLQTCDELWQLCQRVVACHHLDPLAATEVEPYIGHRLACVGWNGNPGLDPAVYAGLHAVTGGVPRRINQIVDRLLELGAGKQHGHADGAMLSMVLGELNGLGDLVQILPNPAAMAALQERLVD